MKLFILLGLIALVSADIPIVCQSCQKLVQNFVDASKDRMKMSELKVSLAVMCMGTSHESDCQKTLDKLDIIVMKLAPYLKNTAAVCSKLQMCSDSPIARLVTMFLKKSKAEVTNDVIAKHEICEECKYATSQVQQFFAEENTMIATKSFIDQFICKSSGKYNDACQFVSSFMIPQFIQEIQTVLGDQDQVCSDLSFCQTKRSTSLLEKPTMELSQIWGKLGRSQNSEELMSCFECTLTVDAMIEEFINKRQGTADDIQAAVCAKVNGNWTAGCNDFVHMYMSTVLYLTYNQFDGRAVCEDMHTCEKKESYATKFSTPTISTCERCKTFEHFLAENSALLQPHAAQFLEQTVCAKLPRSFGQLCARSAHRLTLSSFKQLEMVAKTRVICTTAC
ncbi:unnamed protein product [Caenorhabditis angaria]|uniref:Saposin B-type domain-containing protein n=1 Tax=Caenorhabditis angaria TaxID=860376 RepID=A0A9P1N5R5_9PELO|nr:unnamed protein product [Caenorhabditis angaria]